MSKPLHDQTLITISRPLIKILLVIVVIATVSFSLRRAESSLPPQLLCLSCSHRVNTTKQVIIVAVHLINVFMISLVHGFTKVLL